MSLLWIMIYDVLHPYNHKKVEKILIAGKTPPKGGAFSSITGACSTIPSPSDGTITIIG